MHAGRCFIFCFECLQTICMLKKILEYFLAGFIDEKSKLYETLYQYLEGFAIDES